MDVTTTLRLLHVLATVVFFGGILARQTVRSFAARSTEVEHFALLSDAAGRIEALMVIPGNLAVIAFGVAFALRIDAPIFGALEGDSRNWLLTANGLLLTGFLTVPLYFVPTGKRFEVLLTKARGEGRITDELQAAIHDPLTRAVHMLEIGLVTVVVYLMIAKPF